VSNRQTEWQAGWLADRQTGGQVGKQAERQTNLKHRCNGLICVYKKKSKMTTFEAMLIPGMKLVRLRRRHGRRRWRSGSGRTASKEGPRKWVGPPEPDDDVVVYPVSGRFSSPCTSSRSSTASRLVSDFWGQCYKTFFVCNLHIFVISLSVCPWQAFPA
jgi:hypothetical protein